MRKLGEYLVEDRVVTQAQVDAALARQREMSARGQDERLGEILLEMRIVTPEQLQKALDRAQLERT